MVSDIATRAYANADDLTRFIIDEILIALKQPPHGIARRILGPLLKLPARRFATLMAEVDRRAAQNGLVAAAQWLLTQIVTGLDARGTEHIPRSGPLLVASNHPGAYDIVALIASIGRDDIKIIASDVAFTRSLIATSPHLIYVNPDDRGAPDRMVAIRSALRHLQAGGALLVYPTGIVDPDPDISAGLEESIGTWSGSLEIFLRRAPQTCVIPAIVSSVLSRRYFNNPLVKIPKTAWEKRKLAEMIQVSWQMIRNKPIDLTPRITFAGAIKGDDLRDSEGHALPAIIARARQTLSEHNLTPRPAQSSLPTPAGTSQQ
jgi:Acyltransferase